MRVIPYNICQECCYCIEDYDNNGFCCKDNIYRNIRLNQSACKSFCGDGDNDIYQFETLPPDTFFN